MVFETFVSLPITMKLVSMAELQMDIELIPSKEPFQRNTFN